MSPQLLSVAVCWDSSSAVSPGRADGGTQVGLMGVVAHVAHGAGGEVLGVITRSLDEKATGHDGLISLQAVKMIHERAAAKSDARGAFVMLAGGSGALEEFLEAVTRSPLGIHVKPCGVLDGAGDVGSLGRFLDVAVDERFLSPEHRALVVLESDPIRLLDRLKTWVPTTFEKRLDLARGCAERLARRRWR